ncbi:MAG TPA: ABC transporter permease subunit [Galbitalea sp.]|jgi:osmoprotectant transport system permease protein|nr:ABC transporter permease subunit [Galbitalea sp.]
MNWVWNNFFTGTDSNVGIWGLTLDHLWLSALPIVLGFVISIPLGYWASRSRVARSILLSVFSILYTLPSLVLLVVVPVALGLSVLNPANVIVALTIYAVAVMLRSANDAFASVSPDVREASRAMGYSAVQRFFRVELPLAGPVLLAGIRVVSVSTVSLVTVGSFIGVDSLGNLFHEGEASSFATEILTGIVAVLIVALVYDLIIVGVGRVLMPWNRRVSRRRERAVLAREAAA